MNQDQGVYAAFGDEPRGDDRLTKRGRGGEHAGVVRQHGLCGGLLFVAQLAVKGHVKGLAVIAFVADERPNTETVQRLTNVLEASARQGHMLREIFGTCDDSWLVPGRQPHRLSLVELRILECRESEEMIAKTRMQPFLGDVDLIAEHKFQRCRPFARKRRLWASP